MNTSSDGFVSFLNAVIPSVPPLFFSGRTNCIITKTNNNNSPINFNVLFIINLLMILNIILLLFEYQKVFHLLKVYK